MGGPSSFRAVRGLGWAGRLGGAAVSQGQNLTVGLGESRDRGPPVLGLHPAGPDTERGTWPPGPLLGSFHGATRLWWACWGSELVVVTRQVLAVVGGLAANEHVPVAQDLSLAQTPVLERGSEVRGDNTVPCRSLPLSLNPCPLTFGCLPPSQGLCSSLSRAPPGLHAKRGPWQLRAPLMGPRARLASVPSVVPAAHLVRVALVQQVVGLHQRLVLGRGQHPVAHLAPVQVPVLVQISEVPKLLPLCLHPGRLLLPRLLRVQVRWVVGEGATSGAGPALTPPDHETPAAPMRSRLGCLRLNGFNNKARLPGDCSAIREHDSID